MYVPTYACTHVCIYVCTSKYVPWRETGRVFAEESAREAYISLQFGIFSNKPVFSILAFSNNLAYLAYMGAGWLFRVYPVSTPSPQHLPGLCVLRARWRREVERRWRV